MWTSKRRFSVLGAVITPWLAISCGSPATDSEPAAAENLATQSSALTAQQRLAACAQDPRVVAGLVTKEICAGADIFLRETFNGNGRTCGSCHPMANNTTIDPASVAALRASNPNDPLFVAETTPALAGLEMPSEMNKGGILENVDGFNPVNKFVIRSVPHVLSMKTSITRDPGDNTASPPIERTGWGGDGAPGDGSLRNFLTGAITQHFTKTLDRLPGDFRAPTSQELDLVLAFQLSLGRLNELNLQQVNIFDSEASLGKDVFMDPNRGRCNHCHANAGANFQPTGKNRNFDTRIATAAFFAGPLDGGFGGQGLPAPDHDTDLDANHVFDSFGNGTFSTPPLIEAVDTPPFFHTNGFNSIESAVTFYTSALFTGSPAGIETAGTFNGPIVLDGATDVPRIGRFLRVLNGAFNLDLAKQRLQAALTLTNKFGNTGLPIQLGLINLAEAEIDDALEVLSGAVITTLYPVAQERLGLAKQEIAAARTATSASQRAGRISTAVSRVLNARDQFGANITFTLGQGNLMF